MLFYTIYMPFKVKLLEKLLQIIKKTFNFFTNNITITLNGTLIIDLKKLHSTLKGTTKALHTKVDS